MSEAVVANRRGMGTAPLAALIFVAGALLSAACLRIFVPYEPAELTALRQAETNTLVLSQQLDEVFQALLGRLPQATELTDGDKQLLATWLQFDEQFVAKNATNASLRPERATAHRRLGYGFFLLGQGQASLQQFRSAIDLLEQLGHEHPRVPGYVSESADTYALFGFVLQSLGEYSGAADAYRASIRLINDPRIPDDAARAERLAELQQQLHLVIGFQNHS